MERKLLVVVRWWAVRGVSVKGGGGGGPVVSRQGEFEPHTMMKSKKKVSSTILLGWGGRQL